MRFTAERLFEIAEEEYTAAGLDAHNDDTEEWGAEWAYASAAQEYADEEEVRAELRGFIAEEKKFAEEIGERKRRRESKITIEKNDLKNIVATALTDVYSGGDKYSAYQLPPDLVLRFFVRAENNPIFRIDYAGYQKKSMIEEYPSIMDFVHISPEIGQYLASEDAKKKGKEYAHLMWEGDEYLRVMGVKYRAAVTGGKERVTDELADEMIAAVTNSIKALNAL